jgi:hypothetical protein
MEKLSELDFSKQKLKLLNENLSQTQANYQKSLKTIKVLETPLQENEHFATFQLRLFEHNCRNVIFLKHLQRFVRRFL